VADNNVLNVTKAAQQNRDTDRLPNSSGNNYSYDKSYRGKAAHHAPMRMHTLSDPANPIIFWINPSETQWRIATRTSIEQINGGAVHHEWRSIGIGSQATQKIDQPVINFTFQTGLIKVNATETDPLQQQKIRMPQGIGNLYDFIEILNKTNTYSAGRPNYVVIDYSSNLFPEIHLEGFFSQEGVQWTESADTPNMITGWGASFVVFNSNPPIFNGGKLHRKYRQVVTPPA